jgi:hypothetical protein
VHQLTKNRIGYPSRVSKEHINTDRIVLQPKTWRPDVIEVCPIFYYSYLSSGLRGHKKTYLTILESADHALFKMGRYVLLQPLRPELDANTKTCLPAKTRFCHLDELTGHYCNLLSLRNPMLHIYPLHVLQIWPLLLFWSETRNTRPPVSNLIMWQFEKQNVPPKLFFLTLFWEFVILFQLSTSFHYSTAKQFH